MLHINMIMAKGKIVFEISHLQCSWFLPAYAYIYTCNYINTYTHPAHTHIHLYTLNTHKHTLV